MIDVVLTVELTDDAKKLTGTSEKIYEISVENQDSLSEQLLYQYCPKQFVKSYVFSKSFKNVEKGELYALDVKQKRCLVIVIGKYDKYKGYLTVRSIDQNIFNGVTWLIGVNGVEVSNTKNRAVLYDASELEKEKYEKNNDERDKLYCDILKKLGLSEDTLECQCSKCKEDWFTLDAAKKILEVIEKYSKFNYPHVSPKILYT